MENQLVERSKVNWLAKKLSQRNSNITDESVDLILDNKNVMFFLCVWALFESTIFDGYLRKKHTQNNIYSISQKYAKNYSSDNFDFYSTYFHQRYQDNELYKKLRHNENDSKMNEILHKEHSMLTKEEKLYLLLYTVYRYRNNMFHGNKDILTWENFATEIDHCTQIMIKMIDVKESVK